MLFFFFSADFGRHIFLTEDNFIVAKLSKLCSTTSGEHFDKKFLSKNTFSFFPDREPFLFWLLAKHLQRACPNSFLRVQKPFEYADFFTFCFWSVFRFWANFSLTFRTNFSVKLSKLLSPCLDEHFDGKIFFGKLFNSSSDSDRNKFCPSVKSSQKDSQ